MSDSLQNIIAAGVTSAGFMCLLIALDRHAFDRYGREALAAMGCWAMIGGAVRLAIVQGWVGHHDGLTFVGAVSSAVIVIVLQAGYLGHRNGKLK